MRYTAVFEFEGDPPRIGAGDDWKGGVLCAVAFEDSFGALERLRELAEAIADGDGDPQEMAIQTLEMLYKSKEKDHGMVDLFARTTEKQD